MLHQEPDELDNLILEEKKRIALEFFDEAWSSAMQEGIEAYILAESVLQTALTRLSEAEGDASVGGLVGALAKRHEWGDFHPRKTLQ